MRTRVESLYFGSHTYRSKRICFFCTFTEDLHTQKMAGSAEIEARRKKARDIISLDISSWHLPNAFCRRLASTDWTFIGLALCWYSYPLTTVRLVLFLSFFFFLNLYGFLYGGGRAPRQVGHSILNSIH